MTLLHLGDLGGAVASTDSISLPHSPCILPWKIIDKQVSEPITVVYNIHLMRYKKNELIFSLHKIKLFSSPFFTENTFQTQ